jgi:hypothetical protein
MASELLTYVPTDIWRLIFDGLQADSTHAQWSTSKQVSASRGAIRALSLTCHLLRAISLPYLFHKITFGKFIDMDFFAPGTRTVEVSERTRLQFYTRPYIASGVKRAHIWFPDEALPTLAKQCRATAAAFVLAHLEALPHFRGISWITLDNITLTKRHIQLLSEAVASASHVTVELSRCKVQDEQDLTPCIKASRVVLSQNANSKLERLLPMFMGPSQLRKITLAGYFEFLNALACLQKHPATVSLVTDLKILVESKLPLSGGHLDMLAVTLAQFTSLMTLMVSNLTFVSSRTNPMPEKALPNLTSLTCGIDSIWYFSKLSSVRNFAFASSHYSSIRIPERLTAHSDFFSRLTKLRVDLDPYCRDTWPALRKVCKSLLYLQVNISPLHFDVSTLEQGQMHWH